MRGAHCLQACQGGLSFLCHGSQAGALSLVRVLLRSKRLPVAPPSKQPFSCAHTTEKHQVALQVLSAVTSRLYSATRTEPGL